MSEVGTVLTKIYPVKKITKILNYGFLIYAILKNGHRLFSWRSLSYINLHVATYTDTPLHILSPSIIYAGTLGTYCRPKAYTVAGDNICWYRYFFSSLLGRQYMLETLKVVAGYRICRQHWNKLSLKALLTWK